MLRAAALACLILAAPAHAAEATRAELDEMAACIRSLPADVFLSQHPDLCRPPRLRDRVEPRGPTTVAHPAAMDVVRLRAAILACPRVKPGPRAQDVWKGLMASYRADAPPDIADLKMWIRERTARYLRDTPTPSGGWCAQAKNLYGKQGLKRPDAIAMRDGSDSTPRCILDGSCSHADTGDIYFY